VVNKSHDFDRLRIMQCDRDRTSVGTHFAAVLVAMLQNVIGARVPQDIDPRISRDLLRAVTPEDNCFLEIEHAHTELQAVEYVAAYIGIVES
jgi:hypothetical protein